MMLAALLVLPLMQAETQPPKVERETPPPTAQAPEKGKSREWWSHLSAEEREEMRRRMEAMHSMPKEARQSLERRRKVFDQEKEFVLQHLDAEQRSTYDAMSEREQKHFLRQRAHESLRRRGADLKERFPGTDHGREAFKESRREQVRAGLEKAVADGWLGRRTAEWLARAPMHEAMQVLMEVRKWEFLDRATRGGLWKEMGVDEQQQRRITGLSASEFFREIRGFREGSQHRSRQGREGRHEERRRNQGSPRKGQGQGQKKGPR